MDLETTLNTLTIHGAPMLWQGDRAQDGWRCLIKMRVLAAGVSFEVKGKGETALEAATDCLAKMRAALQSVGGASAGPTTSTQKETTDERQQRMIRVARERERDSEPWDQMTA